MHPRLGPGPALLGVVVVATYLGAMVSHLLMPESLLIMGLWLPNALAIALLHRAGPGGLPWGVLGSLFGLTLAFFTHGCLPGWALLALSCVHTGEVALSSVLLSRFVGWGHWTPRQLGRGLLIGALISPLWTGLGSWLVATGLTEPAWKHGVAAATASATAAGIVFSSAWLMRETGSEWPRTRRHVTALWVLLLGTLVLVFMGPPLPLLFLPALPVLWFGLLGLPQHAVASLMTILLVATLATQAGLGPVAQVPESQPLLRAGMLQAYMTSFALMAVPTSWVVLMLRRTQASLHQSRIEATRASEAKSEFVATVSHDLRTPLASILGYTDLIRRSGLTPKQLELLTAVESGAEQLRHVVGGVLDMQQIEADAFQLETSRVALAPLAGELVALVQGQLHEGVKARLLVGEGVPELVESDEVRLRQVLFNLLNNAARHTFEGAVTLELEPAEGGVVFLVRDTGSGIPEDRIDSLFEPFVNAEGGASARGGSGLGLNIVHRLCRRMGGCVKVTSTLDIGTQVRVFLPLLALPGEHVVEDKPSYVGPLLVQSTVGARRALVLDDDPAMLELTSLYLNSHGFEVETARRAKDALGRLEREDFDLLLTDLRMPELDGFIVLHRALAIRPGLRVVLVTADATVSVRDAAREAGFDYVLIKPFRAESVTEMVRVTAVPRQTGALPSASGSGALR
ncbi:MAG: response regulator [Alphaproteobacteria bacterium]|nr:response regulator [Alphaproteobacteria bacterium]MCB9797678.1 response regulator [Alphaproteobacteria bacterium]